MTKISSNFSAYLHNEWIKFPNLKMQCEWTGTKHDSTVCCPQKTHSTHKIILKSLID